MQLLRHGDRQYRRADHRPGRRHRFGVDARVVLEHVRFLQNHSSAFREIGNRTGRSPTTWLDDLAAVFDPVVREISDAFEQGEDFHRFYKEKYSFNNVLIKSQLLSNVSVTSKKIETNSDAPPPHVGF